MKIEVKKFVVGPLSTNCYILYETSSRYAVMIDPGAEDPKIEKFIEEEKITLMAILLTHGHFDHIMGVDYYSKKFSIPVYIHEFDYPMLLDPVKNHSAFFGMPFSFEGKATLIDKEKSIFIGPFSLNVIETPGHTKGSICILTSDYLFSGDTLFVDSIGRTDFPESEPLKMKASLKKLLTLEEDIIIHPGHTASAKMAIVKKKNPFLRF